MKKTYIQPAIMLVKTDIESNILAGSGDTLSNTFNENVDTVMNMLQLMSSRSTTKALDFGIHRGTPMMKTTNNFLYHMIR